MTPIYKGGLSLGGKFGDYTVERLLGTGGMGSVYLIRDDATGERFATKILNPLLEKTDPEYKQRFMLEAELAMKIHHANLIAVYDVGRDPDTGLGFILMEYVPGGTVHDRIDKRGALPLEEALDITLRVAQALVAVDAHHVVHRDIKPDNIMFAADGITPKLADLGIARLSTKQTRTTITQEGFMIGSPAYMAPEQMEDSHAVDIRADIHALGVSFWEMLAGHRPYPDEDSVAIVARAMKGIPIPDIRTVRADIPIGIAQLIVRMTMPDVDERISSPREVVEELVRLRFNPHQLRPVAAKPASRRRAAHHGPLLLVSLALLAVCGWHVCRTRGRSIRLPAFVEKRLEPLRQVFARTSFAEVERTEQVQAVSNEVSSILVKEAPILPSNPPAPVCEEVAVATNEPPCEEIAEEPVDELAQALCDYADVLAEAETDDGPCAAVRAAVDEAREIDPDLRAYDRDGTSLLAWMEKLTPARLERMYRGKLFYIFERLREECPSLLQDFELEKVEFVDALDKPRALTVRDTLDILGRAVGRDLEPFFQEHGLHLGGE